MAAFGLVVALMLAVGLFSLSRLAGENHHFSKLASKVVPSTRVVGEVSALMNKYRKDQLHYIVARPQDRPLGVPGSISEDLAEDISKMSAYLHGYQVAGLVEDRRDRGLFEAFRKDFARYVTLSSAFAPLADHGNTLKASEAVGDGAADDEWNVLKEVIGAWSEHKVANAQAAARASQSNYSDSVELILALLAGAIALAVIVASILANRARRTVGAIGAAAKAIAEGDIEQHVEVRSRDEFGDMAQDFAAMMRYLHSSVGVAEAIAAGDLDVPVRARSSRDKLGHALGTMTASLRRLAAENDRLLAATQEEANTDALTGLPNRRAMMRDLAAILEQGGEAKAMVLALYDLDGFKQYNDTFGHPSGDALLTRMGEKLRVALDGMPAVAYRMGGDEFCVIAEGDATASAAIARQAASALGEKGRAFDVSCSYGSARLPDEAATAEDALRLADQRMYELKAGRTSAIRQSSDVLLKVLDEHSPELCNHVGEVASLVRMTAEKLGLGDAELAQVELAANLHDIGKVAIPDSILNKPGPLDEEEWEFMRRHTVIGERIVAAAPSLAEVAGVVRSHHERWDGTGYPDRIAGEEIPLAARILAVCDSFSAMISVRPYSDAVSVDDALAELRRCSGSQFDPRIVESYCELVESSAGNPLLAGATAAKRQRSSGAGRQQAGAGG